jgi:hypothetical protein
MKKLVLILALAGMVGSVSATTINSMTGANVIVSVKNDDDKKKKSKKEKKACKDGEKSCAKEGEKKGGCCADKKAAETKAANPQ